MTNEKIEQAALWHPSGFLTLPKPYRHSDLLLDGEGYFLCQCCVKYGFLTSRGRFVDRKQAFKIAEAAGQIIQRPDVTPTPGTLYTEDLW